MSVRVDHYCSTCSWVLSVFVARSSSCLAMTKCRAAGPVILFDADVQLSDDESICTFVTAIMGVAPQAHEDNAVHSVHSQA